MSLFEIYQRFLVGPTAEPLAANASINYVPTLATIATPAAILKHLTTQKRLIEKKQEKVLNSFESGHQLCLETDTTLQCHFNGGTYLPGMDDNLLADRQLHVPIVHVVTFDDEKKIQQVRLFWDQGSLLKQVEVIGRNGRNWPLNDGQDQVRLISSSIASAPAPGSPPRNSDESRGRRQSRLGANGDKYTSLSLFKPMERVERDESQPNAVAPRASAKPAPREYSELFVGPESETSRAASPSKGDMNPLKAGAGKHHHENRLFKEEAPERSPERGIKTNPKKYSHFELGSGDAAKSSPSKPFQAKKHQSQWDFSDFVTAEKPQVKMQQHNTRTISWSDDEDVPSEPPKRLVHKPQPRPDANPHFELKDNPTPEPHKERKPEGREKAMGLYEDHVVNNAPGTADNKTPLGNITNKANQAGHRKTFSSQFDINDNPAASKEVKTIPANDAPKDENVMAARKNASKTLAVGWDWQNQSPQPKSRGINIAGDGMGGRKTTEKGWWDF